MPTFDVMIEGRDTLVLESESWMVALSEALATLALGDNAAADCDVDPEGDILVRVGDQQLRLHERGADSPARVALGGANSSRVAPRLGQLATGLPAESTPSCLDAPDPAVLPAWSVREEDGEDALVTIDTRSAAILDAETSELACSYGLDLLMEYVPAESGAVLVADRASRDLRFVAARGPRASGLLGTPVPAGMGVAGLTLRTGVALHIHEALRDPRHYGEVDKRTGYRTHAILSVPIRNSRNSVGCLQLLNPFGGVAFAPWHQDAAQLVAARIAARIE